MHGPGRPPLATTCQSISKALSTQPFKIKISLGSTSTLRKMLVGEERSSLLNVLSNQEASKGGRGQRTQTTGITSAAMVAHTYTSALRH